MMIELLDDAINQVKVLPEFEQKKIALLIIKELSQSSVMEKTSNQKLSDFLLMSELDDHELLFERSQDTGREINL